MCTVKLLCTSTVVGNMMEARPCHIFVHTHLSHCNQWDLPIWLANSGIPGRLPTLRFGKLGMTEFPSSSQTQEINPSHAISGPWTRRGKVQMVRDHLQVLQIKTAKVQVRGLCVCVCVRVSLVARGASSVPQGTVACRGFYFSYFFSFIVTTIRQEWYWSLLLWSSAR